MYKWNVQSIVHLIRGDQRREHQIVARKDAIRFEENSKGRPDMIREKSFMKEENIDMRS